MYWKTWAATRAGIGLLLMAGAARGEDAGRIIFDSSRSGSFGIYTMAEDGTDVRAVVDSPEQEMYPDVSPDGQWVVYARTAGTDHFVDSQIRICRLDGSEDRVLDANGSFPRFHVGTGHVYFMRGRYEIMAMDPQGDQPAKRLFPRQTPVGERQVLLPSLSPSGRRLAFTTDQPGQWHVMVADLYTGQEFLVGKGCEPFWALDGQALLWVSPRGTKERSGILAMIMKDRSVVPVQDDDAPWGHEYFPWSDPASRLLLWSACPPGQHPHEWSNYQIFTREGLDGVPVRLTEDPFTNRWPKWFAANN